MAWWKSVKKSRKAVNWKDVQKINESNVLKNVQNINASVKKCHQNVRYTKVMRIWLWLILLSLILLSLILLSLIMTPSGLLISWLSSCQQNIRYKYQGYDDIIMVYNDNIMFDDNIIMIDNDTIRIINILIIILSTEHKV